MKITISLVIVCIVVAVESLESQKRTKRGFRMGAADRFSHGFGKRGDSSAMLEGGDTLGDTKGFKEGAAYRVSHGFGKRGDSSAMLEGDDTLGDTTWYMSSEELARLLRTNPKLTMMFVEKYIDLDGDGLITRDEIMENGVRR